MATTQRIPLAWQILLETQRKQAYFSIGIPMLGLLLALPLAFQFGVSQQAIISLLAGHALSMLGITVGYHRLFTHLGFKAPRWLQAVFIFLGSSGGQGPLLFWVATHRRHHQYSDKQDDPHSPHLKKTGIFKCFWHAHMSWMFNVLPADPSKYANDLLKDSFIKKLSSQYSKFLIASWILPGLICFAFEASLYSFIEGVLWGGFIRTVIVQQFTWSVNSVCHLWGTQSYTTKDQSRNNLWLSYFTMGESWHNNHHAFPRSAYHGLKWWQLDPSSYLIRCLARLKIISHVQAPNTEQISRKTKTLDKSF